MKSYPDIQTYMNIMNLFRLCGVANMAIIFPMNAWYIPKLLTKEYRKTIDNHARWKLSPLESLIRIVINEAALLIGSGSCAILKTAAFGLAGPIGSYRIGLTFANYYRTNDKKWIKTLYKTLPSTKYSYYPYIMKPIGNASWFIHKST